MAKRRRIVEVSQATGVRVGNDTVNVSAELATALSTIRPQIMGFANDFATITRRKVDLIEPVADAFTLWNRETGRSYVDFCRALDPTVPADRDGYRNHATYQAMDYLRRSFNVGTGRLVSRRARAATRTNAVEKIARVLKTILAVVRPEDVATIWQAIGDELALSVRQVDNLKKAVNNQQPLGTLDIKRRVKLEIVHQEQQQAAA